MKVFLGGTCNGSKWRDKLIPLLKIDYFNPVVENWTEECRLEELRQRKECDIRLYVITPKMKSVYAIAEAVDDSNKCPESTMFVIVVKDENVVFDDGQIRSLHATGQLIQRNGGVYTIVHDSMYLLSDLINDYAK